jgi:hypothetical protein
MTPNDLFGVSSKIDSDVSKICAWTMRVALKLDHAQRETEATSLEAV